MNTTTRIEEPKAGEFWTNLHGSKVRVLEVAARVVFRGEDGAREWMDAREFRLTFRPVVKRAA